MRIFLTVFLLVWFSFSAFADRITATITITNTPADTATIVVNGTTRTWKTTVATASTQIAVTNSIQASTTNLYRHLLLYPLTSVQARYNATNKLDLAGTDGTAMTVSFSGSWASVAYATNTTTNSFGVRVPLTNEDPSVGTNIASLLVSGIGALSTNAFAATDSAVSNLVNVSASQTVSGAKTFSSASSLWKGGITNAALKTVLLSFDNTNANGLYFYSDAGGRITSIAPDANGIPTLYGVATTIQPTNEYGAYTPSGGNLLTRNAGDTYYGRLASSNNWSANNVFSSIINSTVTNSQGYFTNLTVSKALTLADTTSSSIGVINQGSYRLWHNYNGAGHSSASLENLFIGATSGNFTSTGYANTVVGATSLQLLTTGQSNFAGGNGALNLLTSGNYNIGIGSGALATITSGHANIGLGINAGPATATFSNTVSIGYSSAASAIGYGALGANTYTYHWSVPSSATTSARAQLGGVIAEGRPASINTAVTESALATITIKANTLAEDGDSVTCRALIYLLSAASTDKKVKVKFGGVTVFDSGNMTQSGSSAHGEISLCVTRTGSNAQHCYVRWVSGCASNKSDVQYLGTTASDSSDQDIVITGYATGAEVVCREHKTFWEPTAH